ncbi:MAG: histidine kinase [Microbacteriaceae bacterium]
MVTIRESAQAAEAAPTAEAEPTLYWVARHPGAWFAVIWVPVLLLAPLVDAAAAGDFLRIGALVILGCCVAASVWFPARGRSHSRLLGEFSWVVLALLCTGYVFAWQRDQEFLYPLLAISAAMAVRQHWALSLISAATISGALATGIERGSLDAAMFLAFSTFLAGSAVLLVRYLVGAVTELRSSRVRLAQAAVAEERSRFSRDLHDLLGSTLSVIVVKSEAVRRLVGSDPDAAASHARDIETIGRDALTAVRDAVTGYRTVGLSAELAAAGEALAAGEVRLETTEIPPGLGSLVDSLFGWVVREGTTNVLRHANATLCRITISSDANGARLQIEDDGHGGQAHQGSHVHGLRGLRERLAEFGGELTASATPSGFLLVASLPAFALSGRH